MYIGKEHLAIHRRFIVTQNRIGIEPILRTEAWRFNQRGIEVLGRLLGQLSPYRQSFGADDFIRLADQSECLLAVDLNQNGHIVGVARLAIERDGKLRHGVIHDVVVDPEYRGHDSLSPHHRYLESAGV